MNTSYIKKIYFYYALLFVGIMFFSTTSCTDDVDESNLYVFTGNTVTGYLEKENDFKLYTYCLRKAKISRKSESTYSELLSARGNYTVFAPTDAAVQYLIDSIYNQKDFPIENVSDSMVNKIVRCGIIDNEDNEAYRMEDLEEGSLPKTNAEDRYVTIKFINENGKTYPLINNEAKVIVPNIEASNGFIHAVDHVVLLSDAYISAMIDEATNLRIFSMLLKATAWDDSLKLYRDEVYEDAEHPERNHQYQWGTDRVPQHRYFGYTVLVEPDSIFHEKWGIDMPVFEAGNMVNKTTILEQIKDKCQAIYHTAKSQDLKDGDNAVNQFVAYHLMNIRVPYNWLVVHRTEYGFSYKNPSRLSINCDNYWESMSKRHRRLIKMTDGPKTDGIRINRSSKYDRDSYKETEVSIPGISVNMNNGKNNNNALNGFYYPIDDILVYDEDVPGKVLNTRIRMDLSTYYPELINNGLFITDYNGHYMPHGYLQYVDINSVESDYHYLTGYNCGWNDMYCDEHNVTGTYDFTLRLPPVPFDGTWEVRLVYSYSGNRGMAQLYFGTNKKNLTAYGLPIDQRIYVTDPKIGWVLYPDEDPELNRKRDKDMRNKGYMMGIKHDGPSSGSVVTTTLYNVNGEHRLRKIFYRGNMKADETYYIRFKSVLSNDETMFVLDFVEFAPKNVFDGAQPEDAW